MASVYKTLSGTDNHDKEPGEKRNKQRVLILVNSVAYEQMRLS
jgi:ribosome biogenesis protein BRX1